MPDHSDDIVDEGGGLPFPRDALLSPNPLPDGPHQRGLGRGVEVARRGMRLGDGAEPSLEGRGLVVLGFFGQVEREGLR